MSAGLISGGTLKPVAGFGLPATVSGSFVIPKTGLYEAHLQGGGAGGQFGSIYQSTGPIGGSAGAMIIARKYYVAGDVVIFTIGGKGLGTLAGATAAQNGGVTQFDCFAALGAIAVPLSSGYGGAATSTSPSSLGTANDSTQNRMQQPFNIGYGGGGTIMQTTSSVTFERGPRTVGNVLSPNYAANHPGGGFSAYGKPGLAIGQAAQGYGAGGAGSDGVTVGGDGTPGCIFLFSAG